MQFWLIFAQNLVAMATPFAPLKIQLLMPSPLQEIQRHPNVRATSHERPLDVVLGRRGAYLLSSPKGVLYTLPLVNLLAILAGGNCIHCTTLATPMSHAVTLCFVVIIIFRVGF